VIEFLRPAWLLALPLALALGWAWWHARAGAGPWRGVVDAELLATLTGRAPRASARLALGLAAAALALGCLALAGPAWRAQPDPLAHAQGARIVVLDLSPSMLAVDVAPSRLERARTAVAGLLRESDGAQLGLVVFGADAFAVAPLTRDAGALLHLLAGLSPGTLPRTGSRPDLGLSLAQALLERAGAAAGEVVLVGDSAGDARMLDAAEALADAGFPLTVLAVGAPHGGPLRTADGAFARTDSGDILIALPELAALERVARAGGGNFHLLGAGGSPPRIARGAAHGWRFAPLASASASAPRQDDGAWLALFALPFAALLFRRGWLAGLAALAVALPAQQAEAFEWADLWLRAEQRAATAFRDGPGEKSARLIEHLAPGSPWRGALLYRSGRYAEAAAQFALGDSADAHYNRGNALAMEGRLEAALEAYAAALARSPAMRDAVVNRSLVREALARARAPARGGAEAQAPERAGAPTPFALSPEALAGGQGASEGRMANGRWDEPGAPAPETPRPGGGSRAGDALDPAELQRLEKQLAAIADDPGQLLARRFAHELRRRGAWQPDTGARW